MEVSHLRASRRAHRAHLTRVFGKISSVLDSDEAPNERETATLQMSLENIEAKTATIADLDAKIRATIEDPDTLESEILDSEKLMYTIAEKVALIKAVLARPKPLNVQAQPFQPQTSSEPVIQSDHVNEEANEDNTVSNVPQDSPPNDTEQTEQSLPQGYVNTFSGVSQNVSRLPKLTLPIFGGDPLKWQTFWDSFESAVHSNNVLTAVQKLNYLRAHLEGEAALNQC